MLDEIRNAGMEESSLAAVKEQLQDYLTRYKMELPNYNQNDGSNGTDALDALINDATSDLSEDPSAHVTLTEAELEEMVGEAGGSQASVAVDTSSGEDEDGSSSSSSDSSDSDDDEEWAKEVAYARKCAKQPALSKARDRFYGLSTVPHDSDDEEDIENLYDSR